MGIGLMSIGTQGNGPVATQIEGTNVFGVWFPAFSVSFFLTLLILIIPSKKVGGIIALLLAFLPLLIIGLLYLLPI